MKKGSLICASLVGIAALGIGVSQRAESNNKPTQQALTGSNRTTTQDAEAKALFSPKGRSSPTVKSPKAEHVRLEPADGNQALHDLSDKTKFTYRFENEHGKHSSTLQNQVMDSAWDVENLWYNCFLSYVERVPDAKDAYGEIVISLTLENTHGQGRIVTDPKVEANLNTTLDSLFSECISESSFAFDLREENKGLAHGKIYANMQIGDFSKDWEQTMRQSLELCLADLKSRRPQVHAAFKRGEPIDDPQSVECMERTTGFKLPIVFDEGHPL